MDIRKQSPIISFIIGAVVLVCLASIQIFLFIDEPSLTMYIIPILIGGFGALLIRYWVLKAIRSREKISEQKKLLDIAMESADMGFWEWNCVTDEVIYDENWAPMLGYSIDEIEPNLEFWESRVHPDDIGQCHLDIEKHLAGESRNYSNIHRIKHKDKHWVYILDQGKIIKRDEDGNPLKVSGTYQDITEQIEAETAFKKNENLYRDLFERSAISIWMEDLSAVISALKQLKLEGVTDLRRYLTDNPLLVNELAAKVEVIKVNSATLKLFRAKTQDQFFEQITNSFGEGAMEIFIDELCAIWRGDEVFSAEVSFYTLDGQPIDTLLSFHIPTSEDDFNNMPISIIDITLYKQMEEELFKSRKLESVGILAGGIAHDFNNLLMGYFGNIELAKLKLPQEHKAYSYLEKAGLSLENAANLTKQLLTFAKGGDPILEITGIKQIIVDSVELTLSGSNTKTELILPDDLWQVFADKGQLSQVLTNLIINADQAMQEGGTLKIQAKNIKHDNDDDYPHLTGNVVQLTISDSGHGIIAEEMENIFDPYFSTKTEGSGLGLATVHSIIRKHKGNISVESELGVGTTFIVSLPAVPKKRDADDKSKATEPVFDKSSSGHILVMDDNEMILDLSTGMLQMFGYSVETAIDGKKAIEKYIAASEENAPFDVVIMDLTIPGGMGGKEAVGKLLDYDPKAKVIVSSGYSTDPIMANYHRYGFKGRLAKPFQMDDMKNEIAKLL